MDCNRKCLKPVRQFNIDRLDLRTAFRKRRMGSKPDIDDIPPVLNGLIQVRIQKQVEFLQVGNPPNNIVPEPDIVKCKIHLRNSG